MRSRLLGLGIRTFGEGFLRVIDPKAYETEIGDCIGKTQGDGIAIPIMVTGPGDLITWEPSAGVIGILYRLGGTYGLGTLAGSTIVHGGGPRRGRRGRTRLGGHLRPNEFAREGSSLVAVGGVVARVAWSIHLIENYGQQLPAGS